MLDPTYPRTAMVARINVVGLHRGPFARTDVSTRRVPRHPRFGGLARLYRNDQTLADHRTPMQADRAKVPSNHPAEHSILTRTLAGNKSFGSRHKKQQ